MATAKLTVKPKFVSRLNNASEIAAQLGISRQHLRLIINGCRRSPRVEKALESIGIKCKKWRKSRSA